MTRHTFFIGFVVAVAAFVGIAPSLRAQGTGSGLTSQVQSVIENAEKEVAEARVAIEKGRELIARIPEDSPLMPDVAQVIQAASENWQIAVDSLRGAKESAEKIYGSSNEAVSSDYALLARVNAGVALSGAKVVQIAMTYVEAIADNKSESLDIIRTALQDSLAASSQVQFNYERVKSLIAQKYAN